ncbi:MAG: DUF2834 domain-containing protein [Myxococcota bacterium]
MNVKTLALATVLVAFSALTFYGIEVHGYAGFFEALGSTTAGVTVFVDLVIALSLAIFWMWGDSRERGLPLWPYLALTLAFGSVGPLGYLIHRELRATSPVPA